MYLSDLQWEIVKPYLPTPLYLAGQTRPPDPRHPHGSGGYPLGLEVGCKLERLASSMSSRFLGFVHSLDCLLTCKIQPFVPKDYCRGCRSPKKGRRIVRVCSCPPSKPPALHKIHRFSFVWLGLLPLPVLPID